MAQVINVTVNETTEVVNVTISDALVVQSGGGLFINSFLVIKGSGNSAASIEVGDYASGWIGDVWVAGKVLVIPLNDVSDLDFAVQGEIL